MMSPAARFRYVREFREFRGRGFTLVELLIAIAVLIAVIAATARIFGTASDVTGMGQATANVLQEAAVIEKRMREDIKNLSPDGVFLIRQVAVPNNVYGDEQLLDPNRPPDAYFRADQLLFFADGVTQMHTSGITEGRLSRTQSTTSRVYYGHGFQLPDGRPFDRQPGVNRGWAHDPFNPILPWHRGDAAMARTLFAGIGAAGGTTGTDIFQRSSDGAIDGTQPSPRQWLMVRQPVLLANDTWHIPPTNARTAIFQRSRTARSIFDDVTHGAGHPVFGFSREVRNARMDGAASTPAEIKRYITHFPDGGPLDGRWWGTPRTWEEQIQVLRNEVLYYPRAERYPPSMQRQDQALTNHVIGSAVSSIIIEWTWEDGVGEQRAPDGSLVPVLHTSLNTPPGLPLGTGLFNWYHGFRTNVFNPTATPPAPLFGNDHPAQPWFGLNLDHNSRLDSPDDHRNRGVGFMGLEDPFQPDGFDDSYQQVANYLPPLAVTGWIATNNVGTNSLERYRTGADFGGPWAAGGNADVHIYEAFFGYNQRESLWYNHDPSPALDGYTPWPSAIRVTLIMHDPQGRLENGREFQFTIDLPRHTRQKTVRVEQ